MRYGHRMDPWRFDVAFGQVFAQWRDRFGATQATTAKAARLVGLGWKAITVTQLETGRRHWTPEEVLLAPFVLELIEGPSSDSNAPSLPALLTEMGDWGSTLARLAEGKATVLDYDLGHTVTDVTASRALGLGGGFNVFFGDAARAEVIRLAWPNLTDDQIAAALADATKAAADVADAEHKAAKRLRVTVEDVALAAQSRWKRSMTDERERLVAERVDGNGIAPRAMQAMRGHVTRKLVEELRTELAEHGAEL
jgi:hypothetical protein